MKGKKSILIVDDDIARRTMLRILLGWEYEIVEADCGSVAIEKVRKGPLDLVLMDVCMPEINGVEALGKIKAFNPQIPGIMMTAYSSRVFSIHNDDSQPSKPMNFFTPLPGDFR
jgi:two-component system response regulator HydG